MPHALMVDGRLQDVNTAVRPKRYFVIGCLLAGLAFVTWMSGLAEPRALPLLGPALDGFPSTAFVGGAVPRAPAATAAATPAVKMQIADGKNLFGQELSDEDKQKVNDAVALREAFMKRNPKVAEKEKEAQEAAGADAKDFLGRPLNAAASETAPAETADPEAPAAAEGDAETE